MTSVVLRPPPTSHVQTALATVVWMVLQMGYPRSVRDPSVRHHSKQSTRAPPSSGGGTAVSPSVPEAGSDDRGAVWWSASTQTGQ